ncbi:MAG: glycosyltransferase family 2 protein [Deltaproteobacteria bacterium]|nr:glycosyltransferase family 2 protein [Deltaproteobacteria bacterium]
MSVDLELSIIIPAYNEVDSLPLLCEEIHRVITENNYRAEAVVVDDGSKDGTRKIYPELCDRYPWLRVIMLKKNFGQTSAMMAGIRAAKGEVLIPMDADLQNDPADIPRLLEKMGQGDGYQVVSGWRKNRQDKALTRKLPSWVANKLIAWISGVKIHDLGCTLKAYHRDTLEDVVLYGEMHRFIPIYAAWAGGDVSEIEVNHRARRFGVSKYGLSRTLKVVLDLLTVKFLTGYAQKPIHFFGIPGILMSLSGVGLAFFLSIRKLFYGLELAKSPMLLLSILLILLGFMMVMLGLLAEVMVRTYHESQGKFTYRIAQEIGGAAITEAASTLTDSPTDSEPTKKAPPPAPQPPP